MPLETSEYEEVGFIRYSGADVEQGIIDAGSAGSALTGLDEAIRFFNAQQSPDLATIEYEIPVQTRPGSWEAVVLAGAGAIGAAFALGYARKAGEKLAEQDFKDIGLKDVLRKSMSAIAGLAKLIKHTRRSRGWEGTAHTPASEEATVVVVNERGEDLAIPAEFYRWYQQIPPRLLVKMTSVVRSERALTIGATYRSATSEVRITEEDKALFANADEEEFLEDVLFPELIHGQFAKLEGRLIRGSEASNSAGLEYKGHIINCVPSSGSIRQYKVALFLRCRVTGQITRHAKNRFVADRRPTLILETVVPLEKDGQLGLFGG